MPPPIFKYFPARLKKKECLGKGGLGAVFPYQVSADEKECVVKCGHLKSFEELQIALEKIVLGYNLSHPNILPISAYNLKETMEGGYYLFVKMDRMKKSLHQIIEEQRNKKTILPRRQVIQYFYSIVCALEYLQEKDIAHGNIKPTNIFLDDEKNVKLADIGLPNVDLNQEVSDMNATSGEALKYLAPELFGKERDLIEKEDMYKADVWSLGLTLIELCLRNPKPIMPMSSIDIKEQTCLENINQIKDVYGDDFAQLLLGDLLCREPSMRKSFQEIRIKLEERFEASTRKMMEILQETWKDYFEFDSNELLKVKALLNNSESQISDKILCSMLENTSQDLLKYKIRDVPNVAFNLESCIDITDEGFSMLSAFIGYHFPALQHLSLKLIQCCDITDQGLIALGKQNLKHLQQLDLDLTLCQKITDAGICQLSFTLLKVNSLRTFSLNLSDCDQVKDDTLVQILEDLGKSAQTLTHLMLNFSNCDISDDAIKGFGFGFSNLEVLEILELYFDGCEKITDHAAFQLSRAINEHLECLIELTLSFSGCPQVTLEIETFKQEFEDIPTLKPEKINIC